jgi:hypothetical protein
MVPGARWLGVLVAVLSAAACASPPEFAVDVTLRFDDSVSDQALASVASLSIASSGDEVAVYPLMLGRPAQRVERLRYRPATGTRTLSLEAIAFSTDPATQTSAVVADGDSGGLMLALGQVRAIEILLAGSPVAAPPDLAGSLADLAGDDLGGAVDMSMGTVCGSGTSPFGGVCLPKPVGHWQFDEGSGTIAKDSSGSGNDGTLVNGPTWVAGKVGPHALSFDGVDDRVTIGDRAVLDFGTGSFTFGMWVFVSASVGPYDMPWFKGGSSVSFIGYDFELGTGNWAVNLNDGKSSSQAVFCPEALNQWVRLVAVVDRSSQQLRAYKNGLLVGSTSITGLGTLSSTQAAQLGSNSVNNGQPFHGMIDDVVIFGVALTATQVSALN